MTMFSDTWDSMMDWWGSGSVAGAGREAAVGAQLSQAYDAGYSAPQIGYEGEVYRGVPTRFEASPYDWTGGTRNPNGTRGRYSAVGEPVVYTSPSAGEAIGEAAVYDGMADRSLVRADFEAPAGPGGVADVEGTLPFSPDALTAEHGKNGSKVPLEYWLMGEDPYSMPQQVGAGASDAGASAMIVPSATGGDQINLIPANLDPAQLVAQGVTQYDGLGIPGVEVPAGPTAAVPFDATPAGSGPLDMFPRTLPEEYAAISSGEFVPGRASSGIMGGVVGGGMAFTGDMYRSLVLGEDVSLLEGYMDLQMGVGMGATGGIASDLITEGIVSSGALSGVSSTAGGLLEGVAPQLTGAVSEHALGAIMGGGLVEAATSGLMSTWSNAGTYAAGDETASQATANVLVDTGVGLGAGLGGAALGATLGSIIPGAGTAVGAGLGFVGGMVGSMAVHALAEGTGFDDWAKAGVGSTLEGAGAEGALGTVWDGISMATAAPTAMWDWMTG